MRHAAMRHRAALCHRAVLCHHAELCCVILLCCAVQIFEGDSEEVQREWVRFRQKVDKKMEDALRHTVKKSLQVSCTS
jgi:hypothetical protein